MIIVCPNIYTPAPGVTPGTDYSRYHKGLFSESNFKIQNPAYRPYVTLICCGTNDSVVGTFPKSYHDILTRNAQPHVTHSLNQTALARL